jgi:ferric-dicitrate binding protein FerR (iron transport regulator)
LKEKEAEIFERYFKGQVNDEEKAWVESLFAEGEKNHLLCQYMEENWGNIDSEYTGPIPDLSHILRDLHKDIHSDKSHPKNPVKRIISIYSRVAAILLIPLIAAGLIYMHRLTAASAKDNKTVASIYAPLGSRVSFTLPDNTTGMLNSGSKLSYSLPFSNKRNVDLEGEAWFEVKKDTSHPFEIKAGASTVNVVGTCFNLSAYPTEDYVEVVLLQGKVNFSSGKSHELVSVLPSERLIYHNGEVIKNAVDPDKYTAWTEGKLVFRNEPMAEVARKIERWYNIKMKLADKDLEKYSFRATFEDDSLEDVLRFICLTSPIRYSITPSKMLSNGTYEKETVTIYLDKR